MTENVVVGAPKSWGAAMTSPATATAPAPAPAAVGVAPTLAPTSVPTAFNIGWLLADLRASATEHARGQVTDDRPAPVTPRDTVPSRLAMTPSSAVKLAQIRAKITLLEHDVASAGVDASSLGPMYDALETAAGAVTRDSLSTDDVDSLATSVSAALTAASIRMGRALDLGFDLADTCRMRTEKTADAAEKAFVDLFGPRVVKVQEALADLATSLPDHAARGVSLSLAEWQFWAGRFTLNKAPVVWPDPAVTDALRRQGEVWRSVLAGEKLGQDMLSADDYFSAMRELVKGQFLKRPWVWIAVLASVALVVVGAILVSANTATATRIVGGVVPLLGVVGISTATLKSLAGNIARELERQVWGAELDFAVADALTVPPGEWRVKLRKIDTPPPRGIDPHITTNARIVRKVSEASRVGQAWPPLAIRAWRVRKYMDTGFTLTPLVGAGVERKAAGQFITHSVVAGFRPTHVAAGAPGRLWTLHERGETDGVAPERFLVWTFTENRHRWVPRQPRTRLIYLDEMTTEDAATTEANQPRVVRATRRSPTMRMLTQIRTLRRPRDGTRS